MFFANFLAFLTTLRCDVVISWALSGVLKAVVGPLGYNGEGDTVAKEFLVWLIGGGKPQTDGKEKRTDGTFTKESFR